MKKAGSNAPMSTSSLLSSLHPLFPFGYDVSYYWNHCSSLSVNLQKTLFTNNKSNLSFSVCRCWRLSVFLDVWSHHWIVRQTSNKDTSQRRFNNWYDICLSLMSAKRILTLLHAFKIIGEVISLKDIKDFPVSLWLIFIICVAYYVAIFPFVGLGL